MNIEVKITRKKVNYENAMKILENRVKKVIKGEKPELLWILEHNSIYTGGTSYEKSEIFNDINSQNFFYFTHSYYAEPDEKSIISSTSNYLDFNYCSSISQKNIFATQFHPEKSGEPGLKIYKNFIDII